MEILVSIDNCIWKYHSKDAGLVVQKGASNVAIPHILVTVE